MTNTISRAQSVLFFSAIVFAAACGTAKELPKGSNPLETATREVRSEGYAREIWVLPEKADSANGGGERGKGKASTDGLDEVNLGDKTKDFANDEQPSAFAKWLSDLFTGVFGAVGPVLAGLIYAALIVGAISLVVVAVHFGMRRKKERAPKESKVPIVVSQVPADPMLLATTLSSSEYAARGLYREAVHAVFVETLARNGLLPGGGQTARELVSGAAPIPRKDALVALLEMAERHWFGKEIASLETYEHARVLRAHVETR